MISGELRALSFGISHAHPFIAMLDGELRTNTDGTSLFEHDIVDMLLLFDALTPQCKSFADCAWADFALFLADLHMRSAEAERIDEF